MNWLRKNHYLVMWLFIGAVLLVVAALAYDSRQNTVDEAVARCESTNSGRRALQEILDQVANNPGVDFTKTEGFEDLTPETQVLLIHYARDARGDEKDPSFYVRLAKSYSKTNPQVNCNKLREELENEYHVNWF